MSNYTQNVFFAPKDSLPSGDPAKKIKGSEIDTELAEISTSILSKQDTSAKGQANGYASLDSNTFVPDAQLSTNIARIATPNTFAGNPTVTNAAPGLVLLETGVAANNGRWTVRADGEDFFLSAQNDAVNVTTNFMTVNRTGTVVDTITFAGTTITLSGNVNGIGSLNATSGVFASSVTIAGNAALTTTSSLNASNIGSGSIGAAYVPAGAVTQHQAALAILETQITDGSLLARVGAAETVSGNWTVSGAWTLSGSITYTGEGRVPYLKGAGNTGGAITLSTSAPSGTPANGDIWLQHAA
jgi:hypothetical protein